MAPPRRPSVKDVAELADVSIGTVSNVLNRPDLVAPATRARVEAAMERLNYHRNASARQLRAGVSNIVGVVVSNVSNPFYTELIRGIEDRLTDVGHSLIICSSDNDPEREARALRLLGEQGVRGVLITPNDATRSQLTGLTDMGIPVVVLDAHLDGYSSVALDHFRGGRLAVEHLLQRGHRRIAIIARKILQPSQERCAGAIAAVTDAGLDPAEVLTITHIDEASANSGQRAIAPVLDAPNPPTGVFALNDIVSLGVLRELRRRGLRVPEDVAVVGYDDLFLAAELMVPLTSVRQPMREMGWSGADLLLAGTSHQVFTPELIVRASTDFDRN
ncbi:MAG: LacI family transcriptional regulator [Propionibacteriales bacterium]|nr:LacI family transcriptional regulator [Propionibacteriales bacterium]